MGEKQILLASPHMGGGEKKYIDEAFQTNWIAPLGPNVNGFERDLAGYIPGRFVVALSAGTAALHLAAVLSGVGTGDTVFCQDLTFSASVNPMLYQQARPVFLDSERGSWNLDPDLIRRAIDQYGVPKALVVVHLYGVPAQMDQICAICEEYGITLIEDAAEALGAVWQGQRCGSFGDFSALSFNGNKIITTSGGGALLCRREEDAKRGLKLATQAREPVAWYEHTEVGYNYRMSNLCAGIGRGQMEVLEERLAQKKAIREFYENALADCPITFQPCPPEGCSNHWLTAICLRPDSGLTPAQVIQTLGEAGIEARHIWKPMHLQPVYIEAPFVSSAEGSVGEDIFSTGLCLPSGTNLTRDELERVADCFRGLWR